MIQKGIIEEILDKYQVKVRIPKYDKLATSSDGVANKDLSSGIICAFPGTKVSYEKGDVVIVGFENDEISKPVVLGILYRDNDTKSKTEINGVNEYLDELQNKIDEINNLGLFTHIKYSNDNGITFTSLYDYLKSDRVRMTVGGVEDSYLYADNIKVNNQSKSVYWSIVDDNGVSKISDFKSCIYTVVSNKKLDSRLIEDIIRDNDSNLVDTSLYVYKSEDSLITVPYVFSTMNSEMYVSFRIREINNIDNYHISLTTDKDVIGSTYGDYIGLCTTNNPVASTNISDYSWTSQLSRNLILLENLKDSLLPRIEANEEALYGYNKSSGEISNGRGLLDGVIVTENEVDIGTSKEYVYFNNNKTTYVDNKKGSYVSTIYETDKFEIVDNISYIELRTNGK